MGDRTRLSPNWAAGSYVDLMISSGAAVILLVITIFAMFGQSSILLLPENLEVTKFALCILICMGLLTGIYAGIGFDILPLVHGFTPFEKTFLRHFLFANFTGQIFMMIGLMTNNVQHFIGFSTAGIAFLAFACFILITPARQILSKSKRKNGDELGLMSLTPGLIMPAVGLFVLVMWILRDWTGVIEFVNSFLVIFYLGVLNLTGIIGHFNRRLNWGIVTPDFTKVVFLGHIALSLIHSIVVLLDTKGIYENQTIFQASLAACFFWLFLTTKPHKLILNIFGENAAPHSRMLGTAQMLYLPLGIVALLPLTMELDPLAAYPLYITTVGFLSALGFAHYLHQDHMHISIYKRKTMWPTLILFDIAGILMLYIFVQGTQWTVGEELVGVWWGIAMLGAFSWYILVMGKELLLSLQPWHKMPMFYDRYSKSD